MGIQTLVDDRQDARQSKDFQLADKLRTELSRLGVEVNDKDFCWTGPGGLKGQYNRYVPMGARRGEPKPAARSPSRGRGGSRRSPSYNKKQGQSKKVRGRYGDSYSYSESPPPRRK